MTLRGVVMVAARKKCIVVDNSPRPGRLPVAVRTDLLRETGKLIRTMFYY